MLEPRLVLTKYREGRFAQVRAVRPNHVGAPRGSDLYHVGMVEMSCEVRAFRPSHVVSENSGKILGLRLGLRRRKTEWQCVAPGRPVLIHSCVCVFGSSLSSSLLGPVMVHDAYGCRYILIVLPNVHQLHWSVRCYHHQGGASFRLPRLYQYTLCGTMAC